MWGGIGIWCSLPLELFDVVRGISESVGVEGVVVGSDGGDLDESREDGCGEDEGGGEHFVDGVFGGDWGGGCGGGGIDRYKWMLIGFVTWSAWELCRLGVVLYMCGKKIEAGGGLLHFSQLIFVFILSPITVFIFA